VSHSFLTNTALRERFGLPEKSIAMASRMIRDAVDAGMIVPVDPGASRRNMKYQPFWATVVND
jgi:hypothetical protein